MLEPGPNKLEMALMDKKKVEAAIQECIATSLAYYVQLLDEVRASGNMSTKEKVAAMKSLADAFCKCIRAYAMTDPKRGSKLAVAGEVLKMLAEYSKEHSIEGAKAILKVLEPFGEELAKYYG
jgi:hypothetical protein